MNAVVNLFDSRGMSPLMIAASNDNADMVKVLLSHHADKNVVNKDGKTARDYALASDAKSVLALL
ncbi:hypothetical protein TVAG_475380 [Trichomonas vaginalis G3]|uniref:Uncharacterized protein n=1 Tax=Trichomonas vaginalis (strain ATCC PRA-98 / G3) TaxID=412133 RepID=A2EM45_TRIV3|nr:response to abiotic stimulus [Trichomonas vaginalis G3]EAY06304.1 hypothetical protein TVAG_475380 [Trichomonas vaginalis G3]KAI5503382.1 response to abiotic stimulus [Trichomonas vaginalis G3]|eukprot:XP_001318527.1 hypothetical protein [Trichomonas vaginalis G3]